MQSHRQQQVDSTFNSYENAPFDVREHSLPDINELLVSFMADPVEQKQMEELADRINNTTVGSLSDIQKYMSSYKDLED